MEILNMISFIFIIIAFIGGLVFPVVALLLSLSIGWNGNQYRVFVLVLLWLILIAVLAGLGAYITA